MRTPPLMVLATLLILAPLAHAQETPWPQCERAPAWVAAPPARAGVYRFVLTGQGATTQVAIAACERRRAGAARKAVTAALAPVVTGPAAIRAGAAAAAALSVQWRALKRESAGAPAQAWMLCEVPMHVVLGPLATDKRRAAAVHLLPWRLVSQTPTWTTAPPHRDGQLRFVLIRRSNLTPLARSRADRLAGKDARRHVAGRLVSVLGKDAAAAAGKRAAAAMILLARASRYQPAAPGDETPGGSLATAWTLWEVPLEALTEGLTDDLRAKVIAVLQPEGGKR